MDTSAAPPADRETIDVDHLVVGAGAAATAFVDTLLTEQGEATVVIVDREVGARAAEATLALSPVGAGR